jgi:putative ABC transport system ATP-binding protein
VIISVRNLSYRYPGTNRAACEIAEFSILGPELVAVTGKSGAGKSTLVELLGGTLKGDYLGSVKVFGRELRSIRGDRDRQRYLRTVGFVPQDFALLPGATVGSLLRQDLRDAEVPTTEHEARIGQALAQVGLAGFADALSHQLSGGQRQRVAVARALARECPLIIADEPTAALDRDNVAAILDLLKELARTRTVVLVTHDPTVAGACDRVIELKRPGAAGPPVKVRGRRGYAFLAAVMSAAVLMCVLVLVWSAPPKQVPASGTHGAESATLGAGQFPASRLRPSAAPGLVSTAAQPSAPESRTIP